MMSKEQISKVIKSDRFNRLVEKVCYEYFSEHGFSSDEKENAETIKKLKESMAVFGILTTCRDEVYSKLRG